MSFLNGFTPPEQLFDEIADELAACLAAMAKGGSGHILITDGPDVIVTRKQVDRLVEALAAVLSLRVVRVGANEIVLFQRYESETS